MLLLLTSRDSHPMHPLIPRPFGPHPIPQHPATLALHNLQDFHSNFATSALHPLFYIFFLFLVSFLPLPLIRHPPTPSTQIAAGASTQRTQQILLGKKRDEGVFGGGRGFHEVATFGVETRDLEDVEDVVDVEFGEVVGKNGADEIGVAVIVVGSVG